MKKSIAEKKAFQVAIETIRLSDELQEQRHYVLKDQLLRSGTSICANIREALETGTNTEYTQMMENAQKECSECLYCLQLIYATGKLKHPGIMPLIDQTSELLRILRSIVLTSRKRLEKEGIKKISGN